MLVELNNPSIGIAKDSNVSTSTEQTGGANEAKEVTANSSSTYNDNNNDSGTLFNKKDSTPVQTMNEGKPKEDFGSYSEPADYSFLLSDKVKDVNKSNPTGFIGSDSNNNTIDFRIGGPKEDEEYLKRLDEEARLEEEVAIKEAEVERLQKEYDQAEKDKAAKQAEGKKGGWLERLYKAGKAKKEMEERDIVAKYKALNKAKEELEAVRVKYEDASKAAAAAKEAKERADEAERKAKEAERKEKELPNPTVAPLATETKAETAPVENTETETETPEAETEPVENTETETETPETRSSSFFNKWEKEFDDIMNNPNYSTKDKIKEQDIKVKTYNEAAGEEIRAIVEEQVNKGIDIQDIRNSEDYREFSQKYFDLGQRIYDDASRLDEEAADFDREDTLGEKIRNRTIDIIDSITLGKTKITENDAYEINKLMKSNEGVKLAATAMMKSAAFNGAQNTQGQKYSEAWKSSKASITPAEMFATFFNGASSAVGIGLSTVLFATPGLQGFGAALFAASMKNAAEAGLRSSKKDFTNYEQMFNPDNKLGIKAYNQFIESANIGDMRAASTYTTSTSGAMKICSGIAQLSVNPANAISIIRDGVDEISKVSKGGLKGTSDQVIKNIYNFAVDFEDAMEMQGAPYSGRLVSEKDGNNDDDLFTRTSDFGTVSADDENRVSADSSYSGFREQAINDNLNERFNAGMGKEVSEAVSDERVKSFIVSIYKNEPDFIRKAVSKIMKSYREVI